MRYHKWAVIRLASTRVMASIEQLGLVFIVPGWHSNQTGLQVTIRDYPERSRWNFSASALGQLGDTQERCRRISWPWDPVLPNAPELQVSGIRGTNIRASPQRSPSATAEGGSGIILPHVPDFLCRIFEASIFEK